MESRHFQETKQKRVEIYGCVGWNQFELRSYNLKTLHVQDCRVKVREQSDAQWQPSGTIPEVGTNLKRKLHRVSLPWPGSSEIQELVKERSLLGLGHLCGPYCGELGSSGN